MTKRYRITGMTCSACSAAVEKAAGSVPGVTTAVVNLLSAELNATLAPDADPGAVDRCILSAVTAAGYGARVFDSAAEAAEIDEVQRQEAGRLRNRLLFSAGFLLALMYLTMGHMLHLPLPDLFHSRPDVSALLQFILCGIIMIINRNFFIKGVKTLLHGAPGMDTLVAAGAGISFFYSTYTAVRLMLAVAKEQAAVIAFYSHQLYFESAAMIVTLITLGKWLECLAKGKTNDSMKALLALSPRQATVRTEAGNEKTVPSSALQAGDLLVVRAGEQIPADGEVTEGEATVDQSAVTGESVAVEKSAGDRVISATTCQSGYLCVRADRVGADTTLAQMVRLVREASATKAPIARLADRVSGIFVPVVLGLCVAVFLIWLFAGEPVASAMNFAISVMVVSCPCALGLATPVAILCGTSRAAQLGILFQNATALERAQAAQVIVFDKTGTLTTGKPVVSDVIPAAGVTAEALLQLAASVEAPSRHPYADAITEKARRENRLPTPVTQFENRFGLGVCAFINGTAVLGGNRHFMEEQQIKPNDPSLYQIADTLANAGKTPIYFALDKNLMGFIALSDAVKPTAADAIFALKQMGKTTILLTGDNDAVANGTAAALGLDRYRAEVLPTGKQAEIVRLQKETGGAVMMVGDGINDAPALAAADVGVALGGGTDIAMQSAGVILMQNDPLDVVSALKLSGATVRTIRVNLFWAFFYNILMIPVAAGALYPAFGIQFHPMLAAGAMSLSSLFVVTNALRLRKYMPSKINSVKESEKQ